MSETPEIVEDAKSVYTVKINASVALKLSKLSETSVKSMTTGPIYGFDGVEQDIISVTHMIPFPAYNSQNSSGNYGSDDFFNVRSSNAKFQQEYLAKLKGANYTANLLGWFVVSSGGKFISQSIVESLYSLQKSLKQNKYQIPSLLLVYDASKSSEGYLNLKCYKLSDNFIATYESEQQFIAKNLIENKVSYKNILEEIPVILKSNHLTNLKIQEFKLDSIPSDNLLINPATYENIKQTSEQLQEAVNHFNYNLGNMSYFQRNLSRDIAKIKRYEAKIQEENEEILKANPNAKVEAPNWRKEITLPPASSKYEYLVATSAVNNICNSLQSTENVEFVKITGVKSSLSL
ncbi:hypothetical protein CANINC_001832 [Pichia inconspicua]|uniref:eIF3h C-terminal domain-containing protein n=1 Tax=Pichia inconspicua TaxID=52247 RepID=A0A4T0X2N1_9ASCO|nr:hypothetical protein CANINC_001832 [[Candida] inconspicua]